MFVVTLSYQCSLRDIESSLEAHRAFLREGYASGAFLASGPQEPRTGGVILARAQTRSELEALLERDPFKQLGLARYSVIEFHPTMTAPSLQGLLDH